MDQAAQDIEEGKILRSMHIEKQTAALRAAVLSPLLRAQELLKKDINEADEELDDPFRWGSCIVWYLLTCALYACGA